MQKLTSLKQHLIDEFASLANSPENIKVYADEGTIKIFAGSANNNFKINYIATLAIYDTTITIAQMGYVLSLWLQQYAPNLNQNDIKFAAEILTSNTHDITISLPLEETIKPQMLDEGVRLDRSQDQIADIQGGPLIDYIANRVPRG